MKQMNERSEVKLCNDLKNRKERNKSSKGRKEKNEKKDDWMIRINNFVLVLIILIQSDGNY